MPGLHRLSVIGGARVGLATPAEALVSRAITAGTGTRGAGADQRGRVLVAEDNTVNQLVTNGMLSRLGYSSDVVANGLEAVAAVDSRHYVAVLMDCHMSEMDGFAATGEIRRRHAGGRRVPIIAMTASVMLEDRERCLAAGMDDYVSKPVSLDVLEDALARWTTVPAAKVPFPRSGDEQPAGAVSEGAGASTPGE